MMMKNTGVDHWPDLSQTTKIPKTYLKPAASKEGELDIHKILWLSRKKNSKLVKILAFHCLG